MRGGLRGGDPEQDRPRFSFKDGGGRILLQPGQGVQPDRTDDANYSAHGARHANKQPRSEGYRDVPTSDEEIRMAMVPAGGEAREGW